MIIKKIHCKVDESAKDAFQYQQSQWQELKRCEGFLGQLGGWTEANPSAAVIFSFWENKDAYQYFMDYIHDEILNKTAQAKTYHSISITLFEKQFSLSTKADQMSAFLDRTQFVRLALTTVKQEYINRFIEKQKNIWNPGMHGGFFARSQQDNRYFLVLSGWENQAYHQQYMEKHFPELTKNANPMDDLEEIAGERFRVVEEWRVLPDPIYL
ncbi:YdbC family protein [Virgibacillus senegalensis]|uniref:YdbC family protein n=1 Tax=Virgibacillus senegalensis TaxID=1499679 RepID=UPI00069F7889|nr:YdbC family protein [Virgibacillus senegalensis]